MDSPEYTVWRRYYNDLRADMLNGMMALIDRLDVVEARLAELEKSQRNERDG